MDAIIADLAAGRLAEAERGCRAVLAAAPDRAEALHLWGVCLLQAGRPAEAAIRVARAARLAPRVCAFRLSHAAALRMAGRLAEAEAEAVAALRLAPRTPQAWNTLANILGDGGRHAEAATALARLTELDPLGTEARLALARHLILAERADEAVEVLMTLLGMNPVLAAAYGNLGVALRRLGRDAEAEAAYRNGLGIDPEEPGLLNNLGIALQDRGDHDGAGRCLHRALALRPADAASWLNLALGAQHGMRPRQAVAAARRAIRIEPGLAEAHTTLGFNLLIEGRDAEGYAAYEWRSRMADFGASPTFASPRWAGGDPAGLTLLVHEEQGAGDTLQFARYAGLLAARGARVILACNGHLARVLAGLPGLAAVIRNGDPVPPHDAHAALMSLPHLMGLAGEDPPGPHPYLVAEPGPRAAWAGRLAGHPGLRVGLVWAGNPTFRGDRARSPGLAAFRPLLDVPGVSFLALQKGPGHAQLAACPEAAARLVDLGPDLADFADTAAAMRGLDLVISSCTGPAHLAGALGCPTWTVLPFACDWRWRTRGDRTPWYPTMRLFRQERRGDWGGVMERVRAALAGLLAARALVGQASRSPP
ncbi:tetratricopeptide repeat protein [Methylobacterium sp. ID0610]|uniref:tetratricopeptide repeat protein n=1 Tax=Methylobacterium carpenticola TaxID=3344827 RepID=UPI00368D3703